MTLLNSSLEKNLLLKQLLAQLSPVEVLPTNTAASIIDPVSKQPLIQSGLPKVLPTDAAAFLINRKPQTLRKWACLENGPIRPVRINGRLAWRVEDLKNLLDGKPINPLPDQSVLRNSRRDLKQTNGRGKEDSHGN